MYQSITSVTGTYTYNTKVSDSVQSTGEKRRERGTHNIHVSAVLQAHTNTTTDAKMHAHCWSARASEPSSPHDTVCESPSHSASYAQPACATRPATERSAQSSRSTARRSRQCSAPLRTADQGGLASDDVAHGRLHLAVASSACVPLGEHPIAKTHGARAARHSAAAWRSALKSIGDTRAATRSTTSLATLIVDRRLALWPKNRRNIQSDCGCVSVTALVCGCPTRRRRWRDVQRDCRPTRARGPSRAARASA